MSADLRDVIEQRIVDFANSQQQPPFSFVQARAREMHVLPLYVGWTHALAINAELEIIAFSHEDLDEPARVETDLAMKNLALVAGSRSYPELLPLWQVRPVGAKDCPECSGTGKHPITVKPQFAAIICSCGGAGWIL
jgi:hypothetical protein